MDEFQPYIDALVATVVGRVGQEGHVAVTLNGSPVERPEHPKAPGSPQRYPPHVSLGLTPPRAASQKSPATPRPAARPSPSPTKLHVEPEFDPPPRLVSEDVVEDVLDRLFPKGRLPPEVAGFVNEENTSGWQDGGERERTARVATDWVLDALCHAHQDPRIRRSARDLLSVRQFTSGLDILSAKLFTTVLRPGLRARLVTLGDRIAQDYVDRHLAEALSPEAVEGAVGDVLQHPLVAKVMKAEGRLPTQIDLVPCLPEVVKWDRPWEFPEEIYAHAVLMLGAVLDQNFQSIVSAEVRAHNRDSSKGGKRGTAKWFAAPPKGHARVRTKDAADYRYKAKPVSQNNVDVVRCMVTADGPTELLALARRLSGILGGCVRVKNLMAVSEAERTARFHLLPLMLTVVVSGEGTVGELVQSPTGRALIAEYVSHNDPATPASKWAETTAGAQRMLRTEPLASSRPQVLGELQLLLTSHGEVRHAMHEVYRAFRADNCQLLLDDYQRSIHLHAPDSDDSDAEDDELGVTPAQAYVDVHAEGEGVDVALWAAARRGDRPTVEKCLAAGGAVDVMHGKAAIGLDASPLRNAVFRGYTDVVKVLLDAGANPDLADSEGVGTSIWVAALFGHRDVAELLIQAGAQVNLPSAKAGTTPLHAAAEHGFTDVVEMLLAAEADVGALTVKSGDSVLGLAARRGHVDVIQTLLASGADREVPNTAGETPLTLATANGHDEAAKLLAS